MSEKLKKMPVLIAITAICALLIFALTDLYYHFFATGSLLYIAMVIAIDIIFDILFVIANLTRKKFSWPAVILSCVLFGFVSLILLVGLSLYFKYITRMAMLWAGKLVFIAFALEIVGFVPFFLFLSPDIRKKSLIVLGSIVLAVSVTAVACWGALKCSVTDASVKYEWDLDAPEYTDGKLSRVYNCGVMTADEYHDEKHNGPSKETSFLQVAYNTDLDAFNDYCALLEKDGYRLEGSADIESIVSKTFVRIKDETLLHVYYNKVEKSTRIITDPKSVSPVKASYTYTPVDGDTTEIYQYALMYDDDCEPDYEYGGGIERCGMNYVIKLADNKLIVIDGGDICQSSDEAIKGFYDLCVDITGSEDLTIACWLGTHAHGDHVSFFSKFLRIYGNEQGKVTLERYMYNYPNWREVDNGNEDATYALFRRLEKCEGAMPIKPHTGETFTFGNAKLEILYTHEDAFDFRFNKTAIYDFNDTSTTYKFTFNDNTTFMVVGDMSMWAQRTVAQNYTAKTLKSDIIQAAHHGYNELDTLYPIFDAEYVFYPQGYDNAVKGENKGAGRNYKVIKKYTDEDKIYIINRKTYGLVIENDGSIKTDPKADDPTREYKGPKFWEDEYFDGSAS